MQSQAITKFGAPLEGVELETPKPEGAQVLMEVTHAGVCHSDVHIHDGYFSLGGEEKLDLTMRDLPHILGHEIEGNVSAVGPDVKSVKVGDHGVLYPWIGCGECSICARGEEHLCPMGRVLGVNWGGGFSTHCLVPHEKYVLDSEGIAPGLAATYMCSGITAYGAIKKLKRLVGEEQILLIGMGGVGMMGLQFAAALFDKAPFVADVDEQKLQAAMGAGAAEVFNLKEQDALGKIMTLTEGGVAGVVDFVGSEESAAAANGAVRRGGGVVLVGLFGGAFQMPLPMFPLRAFFMAGSFVGSYDDTKEMLALVKAGKISPIPIETRPLDKANAALEDLRAGKVMGRVVLTP